MAQHCLLVIVELIFRFDGGGETSLRVLASRFPSDVFEAGEAMAVQMNSILVLFGP